MAKKELDDVEKIVRMTEWNEHEPWEYSDADEHSEENTLAAAKRFLAAQSFLLSWQEGKVPTGWRRARRLGDFDGEYPRAVVDRAEDLIAERIAVRNFEKTQRLNQALSLRKSSGQEEKKDPTKNVALNKQQVEKLKADFSSFSRDFFDAKSALNKATAAVADVSFRIKALSDTLEPNH